jgi:hypothetical protein
MQPRLESPKKISNGKRASVQRFRSNFLRKCQIANARFDRWWRWNAEQNFRLAVFALKIIRAGYATGEMLRRFENETQALGRPAENPRLRRRAAHRLRCAGHAADGPGTNYRDARVYEPRTGAGRSGGDRYTQRRVSAGRDVDCLDPKPVKNARTRRQPSATPAQPRESRETGVPAETIDLLGGGGQNRTADLRVMSPSL